MTQATGDPNVQGTFAACKKRGIGLIVQVFQKAFGIHHLLRRKKYPKAMESAGNKKHKTAAGPRG
jgi:hypothetical protein